MMKPAFVPSMALKEDLSVPSFWFIFSGKKIIVKNDGEPVSIPFIITPADIGITTTSVSYLGTFYGNHVFATETGEKVQLPQGYSYNGLWGLFNHLEPDFFNVALKASHILDWEKNDRFCSRCGTANVMKDLERAKVCPSCGYTSYPRISPAVIVLVERDNTILLARAPRFKEELFSVLAGFSEPGETLEDTVQREIREEVGIDVTDIRYFGSQPWPFPDSLMIAFTCTYAGGEIAIDTSEILSADWYPIDQLPTIPGKISIARRMIDWFIESKAKQGR